MDDIITRIKSVIADSGLTSNAFALKVGMNSSNLSRKLNGKVPITSRDYRLEYFHKPLFLEQVYVVILSKLHDHLCLG